MYTSGNGNCGVLGHGDEKNVSFRTPKLLNFFKDQDIKIQQAALGEWHTLALSTDGSVYSWGDGGSKGGFFGLFSSK